MHHTMPSKNTWYRQPVCSRVQHALLTAGTSCRAVGMVVLACRAATRRHIASTPYAPSSSWSTSSSYGPATHSFSSSSSCNGRKQGKEKQPTLYLSNVSRPCSAQLAATSSSLPPSLSHTHTHREPTRAMLHIGGVRFNVHAESESRATHQLSDQKINN